ncbi:MAG: helix-turn-helix transcriptional regulator [Proteobacteria bacterium]|jgi:antitoxin HicB|nr:helix-turn-helix transcriptional regulator [Pseudomonadota bacterium]
MTNPHLGSAFEGFLEEEGVLEEVTAAALKKAIVLNILELMRENSLTQAEMARRMGTSRSSLRRLLDPGSPSVTLLTLKRAARVLGKELRIEFVDVSLDSTTQVA